MKSSAETECGSIVYEAVVDPTSDYDPWSNSNVVSNTVGNDLTFSNMENWVSLSSASPLIVKGIFKVKVNGKDWLPQYDTPFSITVKDCADATLTLPADHGSTKTINFAPNWTMGVDIAGFVYNEPLCVIDAYYITCTDFNGKTKVIKSQNDGSGVFVETVETSDSDLCNWFSVPHTTTPSPSHTVFGDQAQLEAQLPDQFRHYGTY